jgi:uncharacterized protein YndB with AHSA1/START domain
MEGNMSQSVPDRIQKVITLHAPRARVWKAITDARQLGEWLWVNMSGEVVPGGKLSGPITYPGYEHGILEAWVEQVEPQRLMSWRWHPAAIDETVDYSKEPTTLVTFELEEVEGGTRLTITESGFHQLPVVRRAKAFESNDGGWKEVSESIEKTFSALVQR